MTSGFQTLWGEMAWGMLEKLSGFSARDIAGAPAAFKLTAAARGRATK
jgi:hypothetical protein